MSRDRGKHQSGGGRPLGYRSGDDCGERQAFGHPKLDDGCAGPVRRDQLRRRRYDEERRDPDDDAACRELEHVYAFEQSMIAVCSPVAGFVQIVAEAWAPGCARAWGFDPDRTVTSGVEGTTPRDVLTLGRPAASTATTPDSSV